jgi:hypothetical protein
MTATKDPAGDLRGLESEVLSNFDEERGHVESDIESAADAPIVEDELEPPLLRTAVAIALPTVAAAIMVGGIFTGFGARIYAVVAGLLGVALAVGVGRLRNALLTNLAIVGGVFFVGLLMVLPSGFENITALRAIVSRAISDGNVSRPPVPLLPGWQALIGWLMAFTGFGATWVATTLKKPALGLLLPLPVAAIAAISVPDEAQIPSGIVAFVLFVIGLGLLSAASQAAGDDEQRPPLAYELRRALRSLPLIGAVVAILVIGSQSNLLFPETLIDPAETPQKPKTTPISEVEDRVLFEVKSTISGPWRIGNLDVYDGTDWRLPPFNASKIDDVPRDGVVDRELTPGVKAEYTIRGLNGTVLPGLPNTVGIVAQGPRLAYDRRSGAIRLAQGQVEPDLHYTVAAAKLPTILDLQTSTTPMPKDFDRKTYLSIPPPPPAVVALLDQAATLPSQWDKFDFLRNQILNNVVATGTGSPVSVTPERVQDMLAGSKEGSPFEIVAAQAMLARWAGVPSRIGYGFDGGEAVDDVLQVRPKHGATFVEVYFPGYKWLPVIGVPKKAKPTVGSDPGTQKVDPNVLPSDEVAVELFLPVVTQPESILAAQIIRSLLIALPIALVLLLIYIVTPAVRKFRYRSRRRDAALELGPRARVALAYSEFRDYATDFGFSFPSDTPLMLLERFLPDAEHTELAWLTTRVLWGDLQEEVDERHAIAAEELSRTLRRRLGAAQPATLRAVSFVSRLSLRSPYAPDLVAQLDGDEAPVVGGSSAGGTGRRRFRKKKGAARVAVAPS